MYVYVCVCVCVCVCRAEENANNYRAAVKEKMEERLGRLAAERQMEAVKTQLERYKDKEASIQALKRAINDAKIEAKNATEALARNYT